MFELTSSLKVQVPGECPSLVVHHKNLFQLYCLKSFHQLITACNYWCILSMVTCGSFKGQSSIMFFAMEGATMYPYTTTIITLSTRRLVSVWNSNCSTTFGIMKIHHCDSRLKRKKTGWDSPGDNFIVNFYYAVWITGSRPWDGKKKMRQD